MFFGKKDNNFGFETKKKRNLFISFVVVPVTIMALIMVAIGTYSFIHANRIMRRQAKPLEDFAQNILPGFSAVSFYSLDSNTPLTGWFFPGDPPRKGNVIMVHENGKNRLQFGAETIEIYEFFIGKGYNVLSFDLRNSGNSGGNLSSFGYGEWEDVLGAMLYAKETVGASGVLLYGFNSGITACLIAAEKLALNENEDTATDRRVSALPFDSRYIKGFILDSPLASSDDYIRYFCIREIFAGQTLGQHTIPFAIRLSAANEPEYNISAILARTRVPVHIISREYDSSLLAESSGLVIRERTRLFPNHTTVYEDSNDREQYLSSIEDFMKIFFP